MVEKQKCKKKKYMTEEAAEVVILRMRLSKRRKKKDSRLNSYLCEECGFWHVGHTKYDNPF